MTKIPPLYALYIFTKVAQIGSFSQAAVELHVTHGALSRQIIKLENDLGLQLFVRSSKGVRLTRDGHILFKTSSTIFDMLDQTMSRLARSQPKQPLVVSCERSIAVKWLIPRLSEFQDKYPEIVVHISTGGGSVNFGTEYLNVAIRRADFPMNPNWHIIPLMPEYIGPVCSPELLSAYASGDFVHLYTTTRPSTWEDWKSLSGMGVQPGSRQQFYDHFFLILQAAISNLGVAVVPYAIAMDAIASGHLVAPDGFVADGSRYCIIFETDAELDPLEDAFVSWLKTKSCELETSVPLRNMV